MSKLTVSQKELSEQLIYLFKWLEISSSDFDYFEEINFEKDYSFSLEALKDTIILKVYKTLTGLPFSCLRLNKEGFVFCLALETYKYGKKVGCSKVFAQDITESSFGSVEILSVVIDIKHYDVVQTYLKGLQQSAF